MDPLLDYILLAPYWLAICGPLIVTQPSGLPTWPVMLLLQYMCFRCITYIEIHVYYMCNRYLCNTHVLHMYYMCMLYTCIQHYFYSCNTGVGWITGKEWITCIIHLQPQHMYYMCVTHVIHNDICASVVILIMIDSVHPLFVWFSQM